MLKRANKTATAAARLRATRLGWLIRGLISNLIPCWGIGQAPQKTQNTANNISSTFVRADYCTPGVRNDWTTVDSSFTPVAPILFLIYFNILIKVGIIGTPAATISGRDSSYSKKSIVKKLRSDFFRLDEIQVLMRCCG